MEMLEEMKGIEEWLRQYPEQLERGAVVEGCHFTIRELIELIKKGCYGEQEFYFCLVGDRGYLDWKKGKGKKIDVMTQVL